MSDWTPDRVDQLRAMWADGVSCAGIGQALGISRNAVIGKVHRLGLPARPPRGNYHPRHAEPVAKPRQRHQPAAAKPRQSRPKPAPLAASAAMERLKPPPVPLSPISMADMPILGRCRNPLWSHLERCPPYDRLMFCGGATGGTSSWCPKCETVLAPGSVAQRDKVGRIGVAA